MLSTTGPVITDDNIDLRREVYFVRSDMTIAYSQIIYQREVPIEPNNTEKWVKQTISYNAANEVLKIKNEQIDSAPPEVAGLL